MLTVIGTGPIRTLVKMMHSSFTSLIVEEKPTVQQKCTASWESAKPALIRDLVAWTEPNGTAIAQIWDIPDEYVVRMGFLNKSIEVRYGKLAMNSYQNLQVSFKISTDRRMERPMRVYS